MSTKKRKDPPDLEDRELVVCYCGYLKSDHNSSKRDLVNCPRLQPRYIIGMRDDSHLGRPSIMLKARDCGPLRSYSIEVVSPNWLESLFGATLKSKSTRAMNNLLATIRRALVAEREGRRLIEEIRKEVLGA
jgi:hypothetical protein